MPAKCTECNMVFKDKCRLAIHVKRHKEKTLYQCPLCRKMFSHDEKSRQHSMVQDECPHCHGHNVDLVDFKSQIMALSEQESYLCTVCSKTFKRKCDLIRHAWTHSDIKQHQCSQCDMSFVEKSKLEEHMRKHTQEKPYQCEICGRSLSHKRGLDIHTRTHTGEKPYRCNVCYNSFADKSLLRYHLLAHSGLKKHKCTICGKAFGTKFRLTHHIRTHTGEKPYQCAECGKAFATNKGLGTHMLTHSGKRNHKCGICDKTFTQKSTLNRHMLAHKGERPHECNQCHKRFVQKPHLKKHLKFSCPHTSQKGVEILKCTVCCALFSNPKNLREHSVIHEKGIQCKICNNAFMQENDLREHMKTHSEHECTFCHASFTTQFALTAHVTLVHDTSKSHNSEPLSKTKFTNETMMSDDEMADDVSDGNDEPESCAARTPVPSPGSRDVPNTKSETDKQFGKTTTEIEASAACNNVTTHKSKSPVSSAQAWNTNMAESTTERTIETSYMGETDTYSDRGSNGTDDTIDQLIAAFDEEHVDESDGYDSDKTIELDISYLQ